MAINSWQKQVDEMALLDEDFLATLLEQKEREIYARIASLDMNELPIEYIEGKVTGGSINIDGSSAIRRTCSLTMIAENVNFRDYYWGVRSKFKLEIGIKNTLQGQYSPTSGIYPEIVWFPEGIFIIAAFNTSLNVNSYTISITGKDKMSMLNGELGGQLFASIDFGQEEYKNKVFRRVDTLGIVSSENLTSKQYYKKIDNTTSLPSSILETNSTYNFSIFAKEVQYATGNENLTKLYYKNENYYNKIQPNKYYSAVYAVYQSVDSPGDMFEHVSVAVDPGENTNIQTWEKGMFYEEKTLNYFTVVNTVTPKEGGIYYRPIDLYEEDYEYDIKKIPLEKIIRESVHAYAKEPYHNIVINDLDTYGLEQITYKGDTPLYAVRNINTSNFSNLYFAKKLKNIYKSEEVNTYGFYIDDNYDIRFRDESKFKFDPLNEEQTGDTGDRVFLRGNNFYANGPGTPYSVARFSYGDDIGYRVTDLTYTGDLISGVGETLTSVLDKIKQMLGDFEYFYNLEGQFVFQRKRTYVNTAWSQFTKNGDETYVTYANDIKKFSFNFEGNRLISAIQNTPVLSNLKNDFVVWGKRKGVSGADIPIHARYAIDKKPTEYMSLKGIFYYTDKAEDNPSEQYLNLIKNHESDSLQSYSKNIDIIPQCLIDADSYVSNLSTDQAKRENTLWYELKDWAYLYFLRTGSYPTKQLKEYATIQTPIVWRYDYIEINENNYIPGKYYIYSGNRYVSADEENFNSYLPGTNFYLKQEERGFKGTIRYPAESGNTDNYRYTDLFIVDFVHGNHPETYTNDSSTFIPYYTAPFDLSWVDQKWNYTNYLRYQSSYPNMISYVYNPQIPPTPNDSILHEEAKCKKVDWREIIYQMALDYFAAQGCNEKKPIYDSDGNMVLNNPDHFLPEVAQRNKDKYPSGYTGYEQYYTDMQGFWRQLYNPDYIPPITYDLGQYVTTTNRVEDSIFFVKTKQWVEKKEKDIDIQYYVSESSNPLGYSVYQDLAEKESQHALSQEMLNNFDSKKKYFLSTNVADQTRAGWNVNIFEQPESLNFWIEFLDSGDELSQFSINQVGDRQKVVNDDKVSAILFKQVPDMILYERKKADSDDPDDSNLRFKLQEMTGYTWIYLPKGFSQYLTMSYRNMSAKNKIDELIYQYAYCIENVSITALPVYHLQPNTRIYVCDKTTNIIGEYIVNKITLPLTYNGTMSISANLAPERLY